MEATFQLRKEELTPEWLELLKSQFREGETVVIKARSAEAGSRPDSYNVFLAMEKVRTKTEQVPVTLPLGVDINDIIDEINDVDI